MAVVDPPVVEPGSVPGIVQLVFRDGSSAELDPGSAQSRALRELAESLTQRG